MSRSHFILLIELDPDLTGTLAAQLIGLGVEPIRVSNLDQAIDIVKAREYKISAVLVPSALPGKDVRAAMKSMRRREPALSAMAYGKIPDPTQRKLLRRAGVFLSLWDGYDFGVLRFQINRLVSTEHQHAARNSRRVPIHLPVRVLVGGREKEGILYSLSEGGCFVEMPRASMDGARLRMVFALEQREFELKGLVVFANVPGNLQRPNLPLGMGIRFDPIPDSLRKALVVFIQERLNALEV